MENCTKNEEAWLPGSWDRQWPRRVKLVKDDNVLIGSMNVIYPQSAESRYEITLDGIAEPMVVKRPGLWKLYNAIKMPTEAGAYKSSTGTLWVLDENGVWWDCSMWTPYQHSVGPRNYLPLTRLALEGGAE